MNPRKRVIAFAATAVIVAALLLLVGPFDRSDAQTTGDPYGDSVAADNPTAWWRLEAVPFSESVGSLATDTNPGVGTTTLAPMGGERRSALFRGEFDSTVTVDGTASAEAALEHGSAVTLELWFRTGSPGPAALAAAGPPGFGYSLLIDDQNRLVGEVALSSATIRITSTDEVNDGQWHHAVVTYSDSLDTGVLYLDGQTLGSASGSGQVVYPDEYSSALAFSMGDRTFGGGGDPTYDGLLDEVAVYDQVLDATQVRVHYDAVVNQSARPNFSDWVVGDVHVHAAGDSGLFGNEACPEGFRFSPRECAEILVDRAAERASDNALAWIIFTEHAPWLGLGVDQIACEVPPYEVPDCDYQERPLRWSHTQAERHWNYLADAASARTNQALRLLMGQEMGTAAGVSTSCGSLTGTGHFGVYLTTRLIPNDQFTCSEDGFIADTESYNGFGGPNHPENQPGFLGIVGSRWRCYSAADDIPGGLNCRWGVKDYAPNVFPAVTLRGDPTSLTYEILSDNNPATLSTQGHLNELTASGFRVGLVGSSDSHSVSRELEDFGFQGASNDAKMGLTGRTWAFIPPEFGSTLNPRSTSHPVRLSLRRGHTIASTGPLLVPQINGALPGDEVQVVGDNVSLRVDWPLNLEDDPTNGKPNFELLDEDPDNIPPGRLAAREDFAHTPDSVRVHVLPQDADCAFDGSGCLGVIEFSEVIDAADAARGWVSIDLPLVFHAPGVERFAVIVEGVYSASAEEVSAKAWASAIHVELVEPSTIQPGTGTLAGQVMRSDILQGVVPQPGAIIEVCSLDSTECPAVAQAGPLGDFQVTSLTPGDYLIRAFPPPLANGLAPTFFEATIVADETIYRSPVLPFASEIDGIFLEPTPINGTLPLRFGQNTIRVAGCAGANVHLEINGIEVEMTEEAGNPGIYSGTINITSVQRQFFASIEFDCPGGPSVSFEAFATGFIDPSGTVVDQTGAAIPDAEVTLLREEDGVFVSVPDGSGVMSPANRSNPTYTDQNGEFRWDVLTGDYLVSAQAANCHAPGDPSQSSVQAGPFPIPPPVTGIVLTLECATDAELPITVRHTELSGSAESPLEVSAVCETTSGAISLGPISVAPNSEGALGAAPLGAECTITRNSPSDLTPLQPTEVSETVGPNGLVVFFTTTADPQPASFLITLASNDPADIGQTAPVLVECPGLTETLEVAVQGNTIVDGLTEGDICTVTYQGPSLAAGESATRTVTVFGQVVEGVEHGVVFVVRFRVDGIAATGDACAGLDPTIIGTEGDDNLVGTAGNDIIVGLGGADTIDGGGGEDIICGGPGDDEIEGGSSNDRIDAGDGNNTVDGGSGDDVITAGDGADIIEGGSGADTIDGGDGNNQIDGGSGNDQISAGSGNDLIDGGSDDDVVDAADGNNTVDGSTGDDQITTGDGIDHVEAGSGNDTVDTGAGDDTIDGESGDDNLDGGEGFDAIDGGSGTDTCIGGESTTSCEV